MRTLGLTLLSLAAALAAGAGLMAAVGIDPVTAYRELGLGGLGTPRNVAETLLRFCPLALCALAVAVGFRASFFTIGVEGQFYFGALGTALAALAFPGLPPLILIPAAMAAGMAAGAVWGLLAGWLKVRFGVNEVIGTLMLNYIAVLFVQYLLRGPIRAPGSEVQFTPLIPAAAMLPRVVPWARLSWGIAVPFLAGYAVQVFQRRTWAGFRAQAFGANPLAARYAGISGSRSVLVVTAVSGALAGLAGALVVQGEFHRLQAGIGADYGYTAIPIALVGQTNPAGTLVTAFLFAAMDVGATMMQLKAAVPLPMVRLLEGLMILFVVGGRMVLSAGLGRRVAAHLRPVSPPAVPPAAPQP